MPISDGRRRLCADNALKCFGTGYIFERRARRTRIPLRILSFAGIAGPASLGAVAALVGIQSPLLPVAITVAGIIALLQLVMSIWSLVAGWDNSLAYAIESKSENYRLANQFAELGKTTSLSEAKFESELSILETIADLRSSLDNRVDISDKEKRMGMRAGLRNYQRTCAGCGKIPSSMKPTKCGVCGNL